jgi:hypothetical protein
MISFSKGFLRNLKADLERAVARLSGRDARGPSEALESFNVGGY